MAMHRKHSTHKKFMNEMMDETFHPNAPVCDIIRTSTKPKTDYFSFYRPRPNTCVDYNISQTDTKLDAGNTKIHIQQTVAEYVGLFNEPPPPPPPRKTKYFSGGPAQWTFVDEIWRKNQKELQKQYYKQFKVRIAKVKKEQWRKKSSEHKKALRLIGPAWYQELSPNQVKAVDNLKCCILKDLAGDTIINTQENIIELGLYPCPNHRLIKKALKCCCQCAVEFLLILYQLSNPQRTTYSINDRLLLSSVVHLTMMRTLKELHIRIPSPPPPPKVTKKVVKKKKAITYESPYLEPLATKITPPKFRGIYESNHVQYPESPYFCYLPELRKMQEEAISNENTVALDPSEIDEEIEEELALAQTIYESLVDFRPVPVLLRPSKYVPCDNFRNKVEPPEIEEVEEEEPERKCYIPEEVCSVEIEINNEMGCCCMKENKCCGTPEPDEKECYTPKPLYQCCMPQTAPESCYTPGPAPKEASCMPYTEPIKCYTTETDRYEETDDKNCNVTFQPEVKSPNSSFVTCLETQTVVAATGNAGKKSGSMFTHWGSAAKVLDQSDESEVKTCKHVKDLETYNEKYKLIRPKTEEDKPCRCKQKYQKFIEAPFCPCEKCQEERKRKSRNFVIMGLSESQSREVVPVIDRVVEERPCKCLKKYLAKISAFEKEQEIESRRPCGCRKMVKELVQTPFCQCEQCVEDRKKKAAKMIIAGTKESEDEENLRIIEGISTGRPCKCVKKYEERADFYEDFQLRKKAVVELKGQDHKFVIGGLVNTPLGPAYVISGLRPQIDCACAKKAREEVKEKEMLAIMPHAPGGRIKYAIVGVKKTPKGHVYVLDRALPIEDCPCMKVYKTFEKKHSPCMDLLERYLTKMKDDYNAFMEDIKQVGIEKSQKSLFEVEAEEEKEIEPTKKKSEPCCITVCCDCAKVDEVESVEECVCKKDKVVECIDCTCGPEEVEEEEIVEEEKTLKRLFIFKKFLCAKKWQTGVLRKALQTLAEDGYPLAKLPHSHKLPHFKLWMQMRCGKFWTKKDKYDSVLKSISLWRHTDNCKQYPTQFPSLPITRQQGAALKWSQADYVRKLINDYMDQFYRRVKQNNINSGREFFPTTFTYEFPFSTWRDCYFSYISGKEQEVRARFAWQKYDYKNYADMTRFCK